MDPAERKGLSGIGHDPQTMSLGLFTVTDASGRQIPAYRRGLAHPANRRDPALNVATSMPRNGRELADRLSRLCYRLNRLSPAATNPEEYFEGRSEIARELARLADWAGRAV